MKIKLLLIIVFILLLGGCQNKCEKYFANLEAGNYLETLGEITTPEGEHVTILVNNPPQIESCSVLYLSVAIRMENNFIEFAKGKYILQNNSTDYKLSDFLTNKENSIQLINMLIDEGVDITITEIKRW